MYMCIDLKSFYASVECVLRHLDPFKTPLVVCDIERSKGTICLAATPYLKSLGVSSRARAYELPKDIPIIYAKPRMSKYIEASAKVYTCYLHFFSSEDIFMYSIDEGFINLEPYKNYYQMSYFDLARKIKEYVFEATKLTVTVGIGENMFQAKVALDILSKHSKSEIGEVNYQNFSELIGTVEPLDKIWCIGPRIKLRLNKLGLFNLNDIKEIDKNILLKEFGIIGLEIYDHAHGMDPATISDVKNITIKDKKSLSEGQVLFKDYTKDMASQIILEMAHELTIKLTEGHYKTNLITLFIGYSNYSNYFHKGIRLPLITNSYRIISKALSDLFSSAEEGFIRSISIQANNLVKDYKQVSLYDDTSVKEEDLLESIVSIRNKYGKNSILRTVSLLENSNQIERNTFIGGHHA